MKRILSPKHNSPESHKTRIRINNFSTTEFASFRLVWTGETKPKSADRKIEKIQMTKLTIYDSYSNNNHKYGPCLQHSFL